jgi:KUP system potassium uptake protein
VSILSVPTQVQTASNLYRRDRVLTPAQSALGTIQGLEVVNPDISSATIVSTSCGILVLLSLIQPFRTTKIVSSFAPIILIWLSFNLFCGVYNLAKFDHSVLVPFSPDYAGTYFFRNKEEGWRSLGGLLLAFTGVEAHFADLGTFSKRARSTFMACLCIPCLLLPYSE